MLIDGRWRWMDYFVSVSTYQWGTSLQLVQVLEVLLATTVINLDIFLETVLTSHKRRRVTNVVTKVISQETVLNLLPDSVEEEDTEEVEEVDILAVETEIAINVINPVISRGTVLKDQEEEEDLEVMDMDPVDPVDMVEDLKLVIPAVESVTSRVTASRQRNVSTVVKTVI